MSSTSFSRVGLAGRSWESSEPGFFCFEAAIDGEPTIVHVSEQVAFDYLGAWTPDTAKCLAILRLHRADLARLAERKLKSSGPRLRSSACLRLTWRDTNRAAIEETLPARRNDQPFARAMEQGEQRSASALPAAVPL
ncbi:hypothetical protein [Dongia sedimenti]|uniref:DUF1488 family protein n=1 Tax=Dongia sedimenti TaxID=3064282 RepID=A0ABU0YV43_9PROT|nr:hypothetical protein [Rhodospirillaceae bacterium R-7]